MDDTKTDAPLTPDEERALREAWPRTAGALRSMAQRANTARGASWEHGARCATYLLHAADIVEHLLATLDEARALASIFSCAIGRIEAALGLAGSVPPDETVSRVLALVGRERLEPALPSTPCAECALRDVNGECSAQCVAAPALLQDMMQAFAHPKEPKP